jgi:hypothetical protein
MRAMTVLAVATLALIAGSAPAWAFRAPDSNAAWPTEHQLEQRYSDQPVQPYAMNYTDEAAQRLGVQDGKWEAFATHSSDPLMPSLRGGIDNGGAMIRLQWTPGQ